MIPTAVAAPLRPPKSIVAVPESRPWVPITHRLITNPIAPRHHGQSLNFGPPGSTRVSPADMMGFGSGIESAVSSPFRETITESVPEDGSVVPVTSRGEVLQVHDDESQKDFGAAAPRRFGATQVAGTQRTALAT